jgi:predicted nucleic acid-binding protein
LTITSVASAERIYVDPSALRRLYVHDDRSRAFCAWRKRVRGSLPFTLHGRAEIVNSISLAVFRGDLGLDESKGAFADLEDDINQGRLHLADLMWRPALIRAAELSRLHTPGLGTRTLDVLHVSSALVLDCKVFVTYDDRQSKLAKTVGLRTLRP